MTRTNVELLAIWERAADRMERQKRVPRGEFRSPADPNCLCAIACAVAEARGDAKGTIDPAAVKGVFSPDPLLAHQRAAIVMYNDDPVHTPKDIARFMRQRAREWFGATP